MSEQLELNLDDPTGQIRQLVNQYIDPSASVDSVSCEPQGIYVECRLGREEWSLTIRSNGVFTCRDREKGMWSPTDRGAALLTRPL